MSRTWQIVGLLFAAGLAFVSTYGAHGATSLVHVLDEHKASTLGEPSACLHTSHSSMNSCLQAVYDHAIAMARAGHLEYAITRMTILVKAAPTRAALYNDRGVFYARMGEYDAARRDIMQSFRLDPFDAETWANMARVEYFAGKLDLALNIVSHAAKLAPFSLAIQLQREHVQAAIKSRDDAIRAREAALEMWNRVLPRMSAAR
jgi:Flp pilus assembly protein TadD